MKTNIFKIALLLTIAMVLPLWVIGQEFDSKQPGEKTKLTVNRLVAPTGKIRYVSSTAANASDSSSRGRTPDLPYATLEYAITQGATNDTIVILPAHVEELAASTVVDVDIVGLHIIGLGSGSNRPRFDLNHADATIDIGADDILIENITIRPSVTVVTACIDVQAGMDDVTLDNIEFLIGEAGDGTDECVSMIEVNNGADNFTLKNSILRSHAANDGITHFVKVGTGAATNYYTIVDNVMVGNPSTAGIGEGTTACTGGIIARNYVKVKDGEPGVNAVSSSIVAVYENFFVSTGLTVNDIIVAADGELNLNYGATVDGTNAAIIGD
ncbi:MAG: hypothetical protein GY847_14200 [Proteobacteria bacterium]|nr:hypothetical protein [Pseudomonadota bacterium]